ncbi:MAG: ABC transporter permease [Tenericutes bacterium]|jgi:oligopeptide transport system permease protein|nr:ABC transporter permease [Mycoplasmatota bacterium]
MVKYVIKRLIFIVFSIIVVIGFVFMLLDTAMAEFWTNSPFIVNIQMAWYNLIFYMENVFTKFDFGLSLQGEEVWPVIWPKFRLSMMYNLIALVIFVPTGVFLGVQAALHRNKLIDVLISIFSLVFMSIPSFILIFFLVMYVGYAWDLLPPIAPSYSAPLGQQLVGLIIPIFALAVWPAGKIAQIVKGELIEIMDSEHFLLLRSKGLTKRQAIYKHGVKESLVTVIPEIIPTFIVMVGFSFIIEMTYNIYGISKYLFDSMIIVGEYFNSLLIDVNTVVSVSLLLYSTIMIGSLLSDIALGYIDPRIRMAGPKKGEETK